jgi:hypothetical protein
MLIYIFTCKMTLRNVSKYEEILQKTRDFLIKYENIRKQYGDQVMAETKCQCAWCKDGKRENINYDDLKTADCDWCKFCMQCEIENPDASGIEPSLTGKFLDQIKELNEYVITCSSTNEPHDYKLQPMFLSFYTTPELCKKIISNMEGKEDEFYQYVTFDTFSDSFSFKLCKNRRKLLSQETIVDEDLTIYAKHKNISDGHGTTYDLYMKDNLVYLDIEDTFQERRNLYEVILKCIRQ